MEYKKMKNTIYLRIDKEKNVVKTIKEVYKKEAVYGRYFQEIGACDKAFRHTYWSRMIL